MRGRSLFVSGLYFAGLLTVFVGERLIGTGTARGVVTALGAVLVLAMMVLRALRTGKGGISEERRPVERMLLGLQAVGLCALLLYFAQSDLLTRFLHKPLGELSPRLSVVLAALWPAFVIAALVPITLTEAAYAAVAKAPKLELRRIRDALYAGLGLAGALVFAFTAAYVASERDHKADFSYFRTARAGEATRKIARTLREPVQVSLFFPPANEVADQISTYFDDLHKESPLLQVNRYDHAVDLAKAKELGVSSNGTVVVSRGARREQLWLGLTLENARTQLRSLDKEAQKRLILVTKTGRTVYLTAGHGERTEKKSEESDQRGTIRALREILTDQGYQIRPLSSAEGLATEVPSDAAIVLVIGPQKPFLSEEVASLGRYFARGGHLLVALDPEPGLPQAELTALFGLDFKPMSLANDQIFVRRFNQPSDRMNIVTKFYSSHPSVTTIGRMNASVVLAGSGWLEERKDRPKDVSVDFTMHAHTSTWNDLNGNFNFDAPAEIRKGWELSAAVRKKAAEAKGEDGRALIFADSDALSDFLLPHPQLGNAYLLLDGAKWLMGEEAITGEVSSEVDMAIVHTRKQDVIWFYGAIFLAPALVLVAGFLATTRGRRTRKTAPAAAKEPAKLSSEGRAA